MSEASIIGLDNPILSGRLRPRPLRTQTFNSVGSGQERPSKRYYSDVFMARPNAMHSTRSAPHGSAAVVAKPMDFFVGKPFIQSANKEEHLNTPQHQPAILPVIEPVGWFRRYSKSQFALLSMAAVVFVLGIGVSLQAFWTNHAANTQIHALTKQTAHQSDPTVPSTNKPGANQISQYTVSPDLPRYIKIPKLKVYSRVLQVGVTSSGALATPNNVYDAAWYTGSAKPGQPGATLIDGHVSSWTTNGVFYGIKNLVAGDNIQIVRGDNTVLNYQVVKTQVYDADNVDMQAAVTSIASGKSGLNLISCTGKVKPGTSEFTQRVIVFAKQV